MEITITTPPHETLFDAECYATLANVPFAIVFANQTIALSGASVSLNISIYPSQDDAYIETVENGGRAFTVYKKNALFVGERVSSPQIIIYSVPPLDPGTYWMQADSHPEMMHAWLIVE